MQESILESTKNLQTKILVTDVNSDLTANSSQKISNLELTWLESDQEPNTIVEV
jgi:hypothetical protein